MGRCKNICKVVIQMNIIKTLLRPLRKLKIYYTNVSRLGYRGKEAVAITADMLYCRYRFHCLPNEYIDYGFMNKANRERKYFLLRFHQRTQYIRTKTGTPIEGYKENQYKHFGELIGREFLSVDRTEKTVIKEFVNKHKKVLFKPNYGSCGKGIFLYELSHGEQEFERIYEEISGEDFLCEEYLIQHPKMSTLQSCSVNTIRVITLNDHGNVKVIDTAIRIGDGSSVCDNQRCGGLAAAVDVETGVLTTIGYTLDRVGYIIHPQSGTQIIGFEVPNWQAVLELAKKAAAMVPERAVYGWDIAVMPDGAAIIEMNGAPGPALNQICDQKPKGKEIIEFINKYGCKRRELSPAARRITRKYY